MIWVGGDADKAAVQDFVIRTTKCNLSLQMKKGQSTVPGAIELGPERDSRSFGTQKPELPDAKFRYTRPMSDGTLRLLQSVHTQWGEDDRFRAEFDVIAAGHNKLYNISGVPFKAANKRQADKYSCQDDPKAVNLSGVPGVPLDKTEVMARHPEAVVLMGISSSFELIISKDGSGLYLHGLEDSVVPADLALCGCGDGVYDLGQAAKKTQSTSATLTSRALAMCACLGIPADLTFVPGDKVV